MSDIKQKILSLLTVLVPDNHQPNYINILRCQNFFFSFFYYISLPYMISNRQCLRWYLFSFCSYSIFRFMFRCVDHCSSFCCLTYDYCVVCPSFTLRILITPFGIIKLFLEWNILFADLVRHHILILARAVSIWLTNCCLRAGDHDKVEILLRLAVNTNQSLRRTPFWRDVPILGEIISCFLCPRDFL